MEYESKNLGKINNKKCYINNGKYGFGIDGGTLDYFTSSTHRWWYSSGGTNYGNNAMTITDNNLYV